MRGRGSERAERALRGSGGAGVARSSWARARERAVRGLATPGRLLALAVAGLSASGREREWGSLGSRRERTGERRELGRGVCWARRGGES